MTRSPEESAVRHFDIFLVPKFSLLTFSSAIEPLRIANWLSGHELYRWRLISTDGKAALAANGIPIPVDAALRDVRSVETLIVCASLDAHKFSSQSVFASLCRLALTGARIGSIGAGAYLLARAGLLGEEPVSLHWQEHETFSELFPEKFISPAIFEISERRFSCAGGTAAIDLMLHFITEHHGRDFAGAIAEQFIQSGVRSSDINQRMRTRLRIGVTDNRMLRAIELMEHSIAEPLSIGEICDAAGISIRHCQRIFQEKLNSTPQRYYLEMRLRFARQRLLHSDSSILDVAISAGFVSASHFCRKYRDVFGHPPSRERHDARNAVAIG